MRGRTVTGSIEWHDLELDFEGVYTPGIPAKVSGPPEKCYPAESAEIEVTSLTLEEIDMMGLIQTTHGDSICEAILEKVESDDYD